KKVGARGGTLINARGLGYKEAVQFLGFKLEPERELVLIVADEKIKNKLMEEIVKKVGIATPGKGLCFAIEIDQAIGLDNIVEFKK
ncbi:MAG: P-II family nitrogen regulator, partial [Bacilli bacterium]|nr:P-II family nitrogen regulator [Bacilli bacterium]